MKEKLYKKIEDYIGDRLSGQDLVDFEELLHSDAEFAEEVQLHRSLADAFSDPGKRKLRDSLDLMREEFKDTEAEEEKVVAITGGRSQRIWWLAAASVVLLGLSWWFLIHQPKEQSQIVIDPEIEKEKEKIDQEINVPEDETSIPELKQQDEIVKDDPTKRTLPKDDPKLNTDPVIDPTPPPPSIDYFASNTEIAAIINNIEEQRTHKFTIQIPGANETMTTTKGTLSLYFKGELISFDFPEGEKFSLSIYNNQTEPFKNKKAIFETDIDFTKVEGTIGFGGEEDFTFVVDKPVKMKAGLYYYLIQLSNENIVGGSFKVKQK